MQTVDVVILVVVLLPALVGVIFGFLNIVFSLCAWVLAFIVAVKFSTEFTPLLESSIDAPVLRLLLAFIGLFIVSLMILTCIGALIVKLLNRTKLTAADRLLGLFFGMGLGGLIVQLVIFLSGFTSLPQEIWWTQSKIIQPFEAVSVWSRRYLPERIAKYHDYRRESGSVPDGRA